MPEIVLEGRRVPYRLVRSARARVIRIRVGPAGVTVTVPRGIRDRGVAAALRHHSGWLLQELRAREAAAPALRPGDRVPYLDGTRCVGTDIPVADGADVAAEVEAWFRDRARDHLRERVEVWAPRIGVAPRRVTVRGQRTRWGSASATGTISLNWRLMMAPSAVVEYVVVHELAHLVRMDHSPAFWAVVAAHHPGHRAERAWLRLHGDALLTGPAAVPAP